MEALHADIARQVHKRDRFSSDLEDESEELLRFTQTAKRARHAHGHAMSDIVPPIFGPNTRAISSSSSATMLDDSYDREIPTRPKSNATTAIESSEDDHPSSSVSDSDSKSEISSNNSGSEDEGIPLLGLQDETSSTSSSSSDSAVVRYSVRRAGDGGTQQHHSRVNRGSDSDSDTTSSDAVSVQSADPSTGSDDDSSPSDSNSTSKSELGPAPAPSRATIETIHLEGLIQNESLPSPVSDSPPPLRDHLRLANKSRQSVNDCPSGSRLSETHSLSSGPPQACARSPTKLMPLSLSNLSALKAQLDAFIPEIQAANAELEVAREQGRLDDKNIERLDDDEKHIEMDLALGVLEGRTDVGESVEEEPRAEIIDGEAMGATARKKMHTLNSDGVAFMPDIRPMNGSVGIEVLEDEQEL